MIRWFNDWIQDTKRWWSPEDGRNISDSSHPIRCEVVLIRFNSRAGWFRPALLLVLLLIIIMVIIPVLFCLGFSFFFFISFCQKFYPSGVLVRRGVIRCTRISRRSVQCFDGSKSGCNQLSQRFFPFNCDGVFFFHWKESVFFLSSFLSFFQFFIFVLLSPLFSFIFFSLFLMNNLMLRK